MAASLNTTEEARLDQADRSAIVQLLASLRHPGHGTWLNPAHSCPDGDVPHWNQITNHNDIATLIAISGPNHCIDGWGFLARALSSIIAGDMHAARHFAYYAELRASLSILNIAGIGVFNLFNCIVDAHGGLIQVDNRNRPLGTHVMAWLALEHWAKSAAAGADVGSAISMRGVTFEDSMAALWPGAGSRPIAYDLILAWGADLKLGLSDKQARNRSSYVAQELNPLRKTPDEVFDFVADFWETFEPASDPFYILDRHLLRLMIEKQYEVVNGSPVNVTDRARDLTARYASLEPAVQAVVSVQFLTRQSEPNDNSLIRVASANSQNPDAFEMVARAGLLLRSATAIVNRALFDAGVVPDRDLNFWSVPHGESLGFWEPHAALSNMQELWADIAQALADARDLRDADRARFSRYVWSTGPLNGIPRLGEAERIALWGICA